MPRARVTIRDVAARAGVSRQTVSRVINGSERVLEGTRQRVLTAIADLNYQPNAVARSMARGRTGLLACISPNITDYTFATIIEGAQAESRDHGYFLLATTAPNGDSFNMLMKQLVDSGRTDGLIIIQPYIESHSRVVPEGCMTIFAGGGAHADQNVGDSVVLDDTAAAYSATRHLIDLDHRRIGMITGPLSEVCVQNRRLGYEKALGEAGIPLDPLLVIEGSWSADTGYDRFLQLWGTADPRPTAIFAQNDLMAAGVLRAAAEKQIAVPDALSVIGIDDIPLAAYLTPPLTTLRQDFAMIGRRAAQLLIQAIEQKRSSHRHLLVEATFIGRRSTGRRPAG